jgi:cytosine deaminase
MTKQHEIDTLHEMITTRAASAMNLRGYGLEAGCQANLVVLDYPDVTEALRHHAPPRLVISHGSVVDAGRLRDFGA